MFDVRIKWGQVLDAVVATGTAGAITVYRFKRPHVLALSPAQYAKHQAARGESDTAPPVLIPPAEASPWRPDLSDPNAPSRIAMGSRGAQRSWPEIHTSVSRRRIHVTVLRDGEPAAVFVPVDWPPTE